MARCRPFRIPTALHFRRCRKGSYLRPATALGEDLLFRFSPVACTRRGFFFLPVHPWLSVVFQFFFILLAAGPTLQNLIPHLPQFFDDPSLGFGGFLDNAEHRLNLGLQLGVFLQSFLQGRFAGNSTVLSKHSGEVCKGTPRSTPVQPVPLPRI